MWITQGTLMGNPWGIADIKGYVNMAHFDRRLEGSWLQLRERRLAIQVQYVHNVTHESLYNKGRLTCEWYSPSPLRRFCKDIQANTPPSYKLVYNPIK